MICIHIYSVLFTNDDKACEVGEKNMSFFVQSIDQVTIMLTMKTLLAWNVLSSVRKWYMYVEISKKYTKLLLKLELCRAHTPRALQYYAA